MRAITANRLTDGHVVYRRADGIWTPSLIEAERFADDRAAEPALDAALRDILTVVGPYLIELDGERPGGRKQVREAIRLTGPTTGTSLLTAGER